MRGRVLVVDDHPGFRTAIAELLRGEFDVVAGAGTADDAVAVVLRVRPDLVLLDVRLPGRDGIDLAGELAAMDPRPAVVLTSSRPASVYGDRLRRAPVLGFVAKSDLDGPTLRRLLAGSTAHP